MGKARGKAADHQQQLEEPSEVVQLLQQIGKSRRRRGEVLMRKAAIRDRTRVPAQRKSRHLAQEQMASVPRRQAPP